MPINRNGAVTTGTRENLIQGLRSRAMSATAVDASLGQAAVFAQRLVDTYSTEVAAGEVGEVGSGQASEDPIIGTRAPTVLMYGRVQSGKTAAMILTSALCLDNGFRIIVVLTADNVALVSQTASRFKALNGPRVFSTVKQDDEYEWEGQEDELREDVPTEGLVLICPKNAFHLPQVLSFLQQIEAPSFPTLVLDDEADAATPDTTLEARSVGRPNAPAFASTIHRRVIENQAPGQEGESIGEIFPHSLYVQVTATPYLLFLQRSTSRIRPNVTFLLEPGDGYSGGEAFFGAFDPTSTSAPTPPLVMVPANEGQALARRRTPTGLAASIDFFLLAAVAKAAVDGWPTEGFKHLSHPSRLVDQHAIVAGHIERHLREIRRLLRDTPDQAATRFQNAYAELRRGTANLPALADLVRALPEAIRQSEIHRVSAGTGAPQFGPRINFLVGGNILGRGITIDDLLVTYYVRQAQTSQMDTVWQHARMYGYRNPLMAYTRVYLPPQVAAQFRGIHLAEEELRELLRREANGEDVPIRVAAGTRPTRRNATEPGVLQVISANRDQLFPFFLVDDGQVATEILQILTDHNVPVATGNRADRATQIPLDTLLELVNAVPIRDNDSGLWNPEVITAVIETSRDQYSGTAMVYVRGLENQTVPAGGWTRGRLSGPEIQLIRTASPRVPALALMYSGSATNPNGWYPTLVLPPNAPAYIINPL